MTAGRARAVFLDRDGVLNETLIRHGKPYPPATLEEFKIADDAKACMEQLKRLGLLLIVVTNQPDVARGTQSATVVEQMHARLKEALGLDDILVCYHDDAANCTCRKPRPGLLLEARERYSMDLSRSFLIGDRWKDIDAGDAVGCATILIDRHYAEQLPRRQPDARVPTLHAATGWIQNHVERERQKEMEAYENHL